ncbi:SCO family protein [Maritimibacter sp. 55A14]|uniref:SCO family protein n=1 Tax=Maritimibacter sp. 55A14 TaxID=2174844 RepID=UPI000D61BF77|nr:SCO family protein [Maritimibacter sp. 55A14]PWE33473.1 SCO family protein [Maritimibacter sp. 55A14]
MTRIYAITAAVLAAAFLGAIAAMSFLGREEESEFASCSSATVAGSDQIGGPFELVNTEGETVTEKDVFTKPSLVYFGYTYCPDVCPLDNARNAGAVDALTGRGYDVQPVFITVDPKRDTPEVMKDFTGYLHPKMVGLTGTPDQTRAAALAYRVYFKLNDQEDDEFYLVDHTTYTYLVLPGHGFVEFFRREATPEQIADTVACYIDAQT